MAEGCKTNGERLQLAIEGNETADERARSVAESMGGSVARNYLRETSFVRTPRMATDARSAWMERGMVDHIDHRHRYKPPKGQEL